MAKFNGANIARKLLDQFPDAPTRQIARMLYDDNKTHYANLESARKIVLSIRGRNGNKYPNNCAPTHPRPKGKSGWKPECPPSAAEPWKPIQIDGPCKILSLSDIHCPYHDLKAVKAAVAYGKKLKPDVLLLLGDIADFYRVSRWQQDPKMRDLRSEMETVKDLLSWLRGQFPQARIIYKLGNHEVRWDAYIWNKAVELWNLEAVQLHNILEFEKFGIERVDDNPILLGSLAALHGHELPRGMASPVNQARGTFLRTLSSCLVGHGHRTSTHCEPDMWGREITTWSQAALCDLHPPYARVAKWNHGFSFIEVAKDNQFDLNNLRLSAEYKVRTS